MRPVAAPNIGFSQHLVHYSNRLPTLPPGAPAPPLPTALTQLPIIAKLPSLFDRFSFVQSSRQFVQLYWNAASTKLRSEWHWGKTKVQKEMRWR